MSGVAGFAGSLTLCYAGLTALCLTMRRHQETVLRRHLPVRLAVALRSVGWTLLTLSFICGASHLQTGVAVVTWFGLLPLAALTVVLLLPYGPRALVASALTAAMGGVALMLLATQS